MITHLDSNFSSLSSYIFSIQVVVSISAPRSSQMIKWNKLYWVDCRTGIYFKMPESIRVL